jgi:hypothetical protein
MTNITENDIQICSDNSSHDDRSTELPESNHPSDVSPPPMINIETQENGLCIDQESCPDPPILPTSYSSSDPLPRVSLKIKLEEDLARLQSRLDDIRTSQQLPNSSRRSTAEEDRGTEADDDDRHFLMDSSFDPAPPGPLLHPDTLLPLTRLLHPDNLRPYLPRPDELPPPPPTLACPLVDLFFLGARRPPPSAADDRRPVSVDLVCQVGN